MKSKSLFDRDLAFMSGEDVHGGRYASARNAAEEGDVIEDTGVRIQRQCVHRPIDDQVDANSDRSSTLHERLRKPCCWGAQGALVCDGAALSLSPQRTGYAWRVRTKVRGVYNPVPLKARSSE
jgi:hypothetical protein